MLTLRFTTGSLCRHRYSIKSLPPPPLSLSSSFFTFSCKPLSLFLNPNSVHNFTCTMSSAPKKSAFDVLMSKSRAPNSKKETTNSPKKRKTLDSTPTGNRTKILGSVDNPQVSDASAKTPDAIENSSQKPQDSSDTKSSQETNINSSKSVPVKENKKGRVEDMIAELKSKIPLLKKKAGDFDPKLMACWEKGEKVPFIFLCLALDLISNESGRIVITDIVCNTLRTVMDTTPEDLVAVLYLLANRIAPAHEGLELGIGEPSLIKALAESYGRTEKQIKNQNKELGDLGLVAKGSRSSQLMMRKPNALTIAKVLDTFRLIAKESGKDSQEKKKNHIKGLLVAATDCEPQYLIRLLQAKLRIGLAEQTLLAALGQAAVYTEKHSKPPLDIQSPLEEAVKIVKQVYSVLPVYDKIVDALLNGGVWNLSKTCSFMPGVPVGPMLAKPTKAISEILNKFQDIEFTCEYKYDGERAQIHYMENNSVEIYSRNAERNTGKFPDVVATISRLKKSSVKSFILDCELVAYDREKQKILPFQILSTRARKNVNLSDIKVEVCIFAFDMLYLDGKPLIQEQLKVRRERLYDSFEKEPGYFQFATATTSNDLEEIQKFLDASVDNSCEGLIIKTLDRDATYEPSRRSNNWLKLKKDYMESIGDSLDLVPIAAFHGRGKRTGVYGAFLLACYDGNNEEFQSICKIGTGFSEAMLEKLSASLLSKVIPGPKPYYRFADTINPDVWFEPTEVWEVKAADLTKSPVHRAAIGIVDSDKGISLRFPRLLRVREDKTPEQASSSEQVAEMYSAQKVNHSKNQEEEDDD
ncbi:DNA ligase 1-like [Tripterygium wilfordii]|uniref:DNA ligase n=1 Tax=Tripterygium wilfordii TaxID=458696 RepID=A0A7J7C0L5_TRIWF|nr:DNA ligase 1 [Tripterygium wilfordii]XP_038693019.1 DNA ligase 1 [Tripterygium wilfordii]KAF5727475.1 DNA ligase 1-like [Tripterygium wilfordii]